MNTIRTTSKALPAGVETPKIISLSFRLKFWIDLLFISLDYTDYELTAKKGYRQIFDFFVLKNYCTLASSKLLVLCLQYIQ